MSSRNVVTPSIFQNVYFYVSSGCFGNPILTVIVFRTNLRPPSWGLFSPEQGGSRFPCNISTYLPR